MSFLYLTFTVFLTCLTLRVFFFFLTVFDSSEVFPEEVVGVSEVTGFASSLGITSVLVSLQPVFVHLKVVTHCVRLNCRKD